MHLSAVKFHTNALSFYSLAVKQFTANMLGLTEKHPAASDCSTPVETKQGALLLLYSSKF